MKIQYVHNKQLGPAAAAAVEQANDIIAEYQADNLILTLRQLYYQFVSRGLLENKQSNYKRLGKWIGDARLLGLISWTAIEDRTRNLRGNNHWQDPADLITWAARDELIVELAPAVIAWLIEKEGL